MKTLKLMRKHGLARTPSSLGSLLLTGVGCILIIIWGVRRADSTISRQGGISLIACLLWPARLNNGVYNHPHPPPERRHGSKQQVLPDHCRHEGHSRPISTHISMSSFHQDTYQVTLRSNYAQIGASLTLFDQILQKDLGGLSVTGSVGCGWFGTPMTLLWGRLSV